MTSWYLFILSLGKIMAQCFTFLKMFHRSCRLTSRCESEIKTRCIVYQKFLVCMQLSDAINMVNKHAVNGLLLLKSKNKFYNNIVTKIE